MDGLIAYALSKKYTDGKTSSIATGMSWKGTKENISDLPQTGNQTGDLWHVNEDGNEYAWDGSNWEALGGIHSGSSAPFEIPITQSGSTYTTTATAEEIIAHADNCVLVQAGTGSVMRPSVYFVQGSYAQIIFSGTDSVNGFIQNVTFIVTVNNGTVTIEYYRAEADGSAPFEIPITQSGSTYTTTATAEEILANKDNCVAVVGGKVRVSADYVGASGTTALLVFSFIDATSPTAPDVVFAVMVQNNSVTVAHSTRDVKDLPTVTASDNGKFLRVVNGAWAADTVPSAESNSFGGGT